MIGIVWPRMQRRRGRHCGSAGRLEANLCSTQSRAQRSPKLAEALDPGQGYPKQSQREKRGKSRFKGGRAAEPMAHSQERRRPAHKRTGLRATKTKRTGPQMKNGWVLQCCRLDCVIPCLRLSPVCVEQTKNTQGMRGSRPHHAAGTTPHHALSPEPCQATVLRHTTVVGENIRQLPQYFRLRRVGPLRQQGNPPLSREERGLIGKRGCRPKKTNPLRISAEAIDD